MILVDVVKNPLWPSAQRERKCHGSGLRRTAAACTFLASVRQGQLLVTVALYHLQHFEWMTICEILFSQGGQVNGLGLEPLTGIQRKCKMGREVFSSLERKSKGDGGGGRGG